MSRLQCGILVSVALTLLATAPVRAQFVPIPPRPVVAPPIVPTQPTTGGAPAGGFAPPPAYGVYPGVGFYGQANPYGGYFNGIANLTSAQGQYNLDTQAARMSAQRVEQEKIRTRQLLAQQRRYEQSLLPTTEEIEQKKRRLQYRRAMNDPPLTEIISGDALNTLMKHIQTLQTAGVVGPTVSLDQSLLKRINVSGAGGGNAAAFQSKKVKWPLILRDTPYDADRKKFQELSDKALKQLASDELQLSTIRAMQSTVGHIESTLNGMAKDMGLQDIVIAQRQIEKLRDGIRALQSPSAGNYFNKKWVAKGANVNELIYNMTREGLRFAPAQETDYAAYKLVHRALVSYSYGASQARK